MFIVRIEHFIRYSFAQKKSLHARNLPIAIALKAFILILNFHINIVIHLRDQLEILTLIKSHTCYNL